MKFHDPYWFILLILFLIPILRLVFNGKIKYLKNDQVRLPVPSKKIWSPSIRIRSFSPRILHLAGYCIAGIFIIVAIARPQTSLQKIKKSVEGIDIMLVLDLSASMRVEDFRDQNRFEVAKKVIQEFIDARSSDKIGFQVFSGESVTLIPPTLDYSLLSEALQNTEIGELKDGTAIGDALSTAVGRLKESTAKSRVIILVTDGDSNIGQVDPLTAGELAKGYGIKVYSVAIGKDGRVAMPFVSKDIFGRKIKQYQYYDSSINPELLKQISTSTNGKFYRVQDDIKVFRDVFKEIDQLEKNKIETHEQVRYEEHYMRYLKIGILLLILNFIFQNTVFRVYP